MRVVPSSLASTGPWTVLTVLMRRDSRRHGCSVRRPMSLPRSLLAALVLCAVVAAPASAAVTAREGMERCAAFGAKRPGSPADAAAARDIESRFRAAGLETSVEQFHLPAYTVHDVAIDVVGA